MVVGSGIIDLWIPESRSLKEKRGKLSRILKRTQNTFNISIAEIGDADHWKRAKIGFSVVGNDKSYVNEFHDWEGKGCDLFRATIESLQMGEIPDFDNLIDENMQEDSLYGGGRRGRIGRKSPNIKPGQLLGMKK